MNAPKITLKKKYTLEQAKQVVVPILDYIETLEYDINTLRGLEQVPGSGIDRMVARKTRMQLERTRNGYTTLLDTIERRIIESIYQYSVACKFWMGGVKGKYTREAYYSATGMLWVDVVNSDLEDKLMRALKDLVSKFIGYTEVYWWFDLENEIEAKGWQEIPLDNERDQKEYAKLRDTYDLFIEDYTQDVVSQKQGKVSEL